MTFDKNISPEDLRQFLQSKYGPGVQVEVFPKTQREETQAEGEAPSERRDKALEFNYRPKDIKDYLDRFVIQQDEAKKVLATAICDHYHQIQSGEQAEDWRDYKKQNIILTGPTGVGKTYLIQNIARLIGVPFAKADATKYSETGYVGGDVEDLVRELVSQAGGDVKLAECGIVYLDEVDKIASPVNTMGRDVSGHGVQRGLLKLMEETEVPLRSPTDIASQMQAFIEFQSKGKVEKKTINTRHILFIVSGAFNGLTEIIKRRIGSRQIGFMGEKTSADQESYLLEQVKSVDFIEYGFEAEFVGRLPVVVHCNQLNAEDMFNILKYSEGSLLKQYKKDFLAYGIDIYFSDGGMKAIAEKAAEEQTGARGLMSVCEKLFRDFKYYLPNTDVREVIVTEELVDDPQKVLRQLLENNQFFTAQVQSWKLHKVSSSLRERYGVSIEFTPEAAQELIQKAEVSGQEPEVYCRELFQTYEHALNLLGQRAASNTYKISSESLQNLGASFEGWIKESYQ